MREDINTIIITGTLKADCETRVTQSNLNFIDFEVITTGKKWNNESRQYELSDTVIPVTKFLKDDERHLLNDLKAGCPVVIYGHISSKEVNSKDSVKTIADIKVDRILTWERKAAQQELEELFQEPESPKQTKAQGKAKGPEELEDDFDSIPF